MDQNGVPSGGVVAIGAKLLLSTSLPVIGISALSGADQAALEATAREIGNAWRDPRARRARS